MSKKQPPLPKKILIHDELGQRWEVDSDDDLWEDVLKLTKNGKEDAILPLSVIYAKRGFGWWSCFQSQDAWIKAINIPMPDHNLLEDAANANTQDLGPLLQRFGSYVSYLEAQIGIIAGRRTALKQVYDAAVLVHMAELEGGTQKDKEAAAVAESETLRQTKRLQIENDALYETAQGMCRAYQKAWETASRLTSIRLAEMELQPRRTL